MSLWAIRSLQSWRRRPQAECVVCLEREAQMIQLWPRTVAASSAASHCVPAPLYHRQDRPAPPGYTAAESCLTSKGLVLALFGHCEPGLLLIQPCASQTRYEDSPALGLPLRLQEIPTLSSSMFGQAEALLIHDLQA